MSIASKIQPSEIIKCLNIAREYPKYYLPLLEQQINSFTNDFQYRINKDTICQTNQGKDAWLIAKKFLESQKPVSPLITLNGLNRAAQSHAFDLQKMDQITHSGSQGTSFVDRIMKFCQKNEGALVQIIGSDFDISERNHAEMIVLGLIIDDGVSSRGHRSSIFNEQYRYAGCGVANLSGKVVGVINMSQSKLKEKASYGNVSTSTTSLSQNELSRNISQKSRQWENSKVCSKPHQKDDCSSISSQRSHKSQKVWTFTKMDDHSKKTIHAKNNQTQKCQPRQNNDSKISINRKSQDNIQNPPGSYISRKQTSKVNRSQNGSRVDLKPTFGNKQQNEKERCLGQDLTNTRGSNMLNTRFLEQQKLMNGSSFKSQGSSGFKKIKQKKQTSRIWQEGQFKYQQKVTQIKYTDGTQEQYKERKSLLLEENQMF